MILQAEVAIDQMGTEVSELPGGVAAFVRFLFQVPQWIQIGGALLGAAIAAFLAVTAWRRRKEILEFVASRSKQTKILAGIGVLVMLTIGAVAGTRSWDYMQHDNDFCTGCHVMEGPYQRFTRSEHDSLSCHNCHQQSIFASTRQLYLWVLERPQEIGAHATVGDSICENCHVTGEEETWQRVASTAGHRTHMESDSSDLADVRCVTCHGQKVHSFAPVDSTCAQANCHISQEITLGNMEGLSDLHCVGCHDFTAEVPALATRDSAASTLVPSETQCLSCHAMQNLVGKFEVARDPHAGTCGDCHNPHEQYVPADARNSCTTSGCHSDWRFEPFHVGGNHREVGEDCLTCHAPHQAELDASDCLGCHTRVAADTTVDASVRRKLLRTLPRRQGASLLTDPTPTLNPRRSALDVFQRRAGKGDRHFFGSSSQPLVHAAPAEAAPDSFSHDDHEELSCLNCHDPSGDEGVVNFEVPEGCQLCHHQSNQDVSCTTCHEDPETTTPDAERPSHLLTMEVEGAPAREVLADYSHDPHSGIECQNCHQTDPLDMGVHSGNETCDACHEDHHAPERNCIGCHGGRVVAGADTVHVPAVETHLECASCHPSSDIRSTLPDRLLCETCHQPETDHYVSQECTTCHMWGDPEEIRDLILANDSTSDSN